MKPPRLVSLLFALVALVGCRGDSLQEPAPAEAPAPVEETPAPEPSGLETFELRTGGADETAPVVVVFHGWGDNAQRFLRLYASYPGTARVIAAQAPIPHGESGWSWFTITRGPDGSTWSPPEVLAIAERAARLIREIGGPPPVVSGFSQGGVLAYVLAARHGEVVRAALPIGARLDPALLPAEAPDARPPVVAFHGEADERVSFESDRESVAALRALGFQAKIHAYPGVGHSVPRPMMRDLYAELSEALSD